MNSLIVRKYGGSSLATPEKIKSVAEDLARLHQSGTPLVVVVSAMGKTTDDLIQLAHSMSQRPAPRELDMLISTGERVSMALLAIALQELRRPAISFTGSQAGILTSPSHTNAHIIDLKPTRVSEELNAGKVIVIAGFQGVCPRTKEVTTLGRGGSDTSAVALAAHFRAPRCEVLKDVPGVFSMDPKWGHPAAHLPELSYGHLHHMTYWGAKILHHRSVALAQKLKVPLLIGLAHGKGTTTQVLSETQMYESASVLATSHKENLLAANWPGPELHEGLEQISRCVEEEKVLQPERMHFTKTAEGWRFYLASPKEHLPALKNALNKAGFHVAEDLKAALTLTGSELASGRTLSHLLGALAADRIQPESFAPGVHGLTLLLAQSQLSRATQVVAEHLAKDPTSGPVAAQSS